MILISGASNNHYLTLIQFIESFILNKVNSKLIIYNLGIDEDKWHFIKNKYSLNNFIFKIFNYSIYPEWFNININRGEYAWKPAILYEVYSEFNNEIIVWMDSGNIILNNLNELVQIINDNGIYSSITLGTIKEWTHPDTIRLLRCSNINNINKNGACIGFNTKIMWVKNFITIFYKASLNKNIIAPQGSSRDNHRQDQAVFTILFYEYINHYKFKNYDYNIGYSIHNDLIGSEDSN